MCVVILGISSVMLGPQQCGAMRGYDGAVHTELERRMMAALLTYHSWRESVAPFTRPWSHTGPSDGGEVAR